MPGRSELYVTEVKSDQVLDLESISPSVFEDDDFGAWSALASALRVRLATLQERLFAEGRQKVLIVLQAMDAGGKDGVIRHLFSNLDPQGARVVSFKVPTDDEAAYDFLWRVHQRVPTKGEIVIFNRSHLEDVMALKLNSEIHTHRARRRIEHINAFERLLADEGTTIVKLFLHIDKKEQARRLRARRENPEHHWKFSEADLENHHRWDDWIRAYGEVLPQTSTPWAPWYVVPANDRAVRNALVTHHLVAVLERLDPQIPINETITRCAE